MRPCCSWLSMIYFSHDLSQVIFGWKLELYWNVQMTSIYNSNSEKYVRNARGGEEKAYNNVFAFKSDLLNSKVLFLLCALGSLSLLSLLCINRSPWERSLCSVLIPQLQKLSNFAVVPPGLDRPMPCHRAMHGIPHHSLMWDFGMRFQTFVLWVDAAVENLLLILRIFRFISRVLKWDHCWSDIFWYKTRTRRPETWMTSVFSDFTYYGNVYPCINLVYIESERI